MSDKKQHSLDRVIDVAAIKFATSQMADVSIRQIASEAKCSLATIYDIFGSKEGLYRAAVARYLSHSQFSYESGSYREDGTSMSSLLALLEARIRFLMDPERVMSHRLVSAHAKMSGDILRDIIKQEKARISSHIQDSCQKCVEDGYFYELDLASVTYILMACTAYESFNDGLFMQSSDDVDCKSIIEKSIHPFLTHDGNIYMEKYFRKNSSEMKLNLIN